MEDTVLYEVRGPLALVTLNRPDRLNALTTPMIAQALAALRRGEADPAVFAIAVTGAGRGFCAGIDAEQLMVATSEGIAEVSDEDKVPGLFVELPSISKPIIAAVNGPAAGAGFILAMMCDLRFMAEEAVMTTMFSKRGLIAEHQSSWVLPRLVGLSRALDLLWSSRRIDGAEAYRIGLADRLVPAAGLLDAIQTYVEEMARTVAPRAVAIAKAQVYRHLATDLPTAARETYALVRESLSHPDAREGAVSFVERRAPNFVAWTGADG